MKLSWKRALYFLGQLCLTKGHLGNQEGLQESEYPPPNRKLLLTPLIQIKKNFKKGFFKGSVQSWTLYLSKIGPVYVCQT